MFVKFCVVAPFDQAYVYGDVDPLTVVVIDPLLSPQVELVGDNDTLTAVPPVTVILCTVEQLLASVAVTV